MQASGSPDFGIYAAHSLIPAVGSAAHVCAEFPYVLGRTGPKGTVCGPVVPLNGSGVVVSSLRLVGSRRFCGSASRLTTASNATPRCGEPDAKASRRKLVQSDRCPTLPLEPAHDMRSIATIDTTRPLPSRRSAVRSKRCRDAGARGGCGRRRRAGGADHGRRGGAAAVVIRSRRRESVLRRGRAQHEPLVAQLLLRGVRAGRTGVGRQGPGRPLAAGRQRQALRVHATSRATAGGGSPGSWRSRCSTTWCAASSARVAGLGAAATLAVLPAAILTAHSDTMDSVMMALDVLAAWLVVVGAQRRSAWPVVAAGAVVGLAFNVKLFEALIFAAGAGAARAPGRRGSACGGGRSRSAGALAALLAVGLGWIAVASLTAARAAAVADRLDRRQHLERRLRATTAWIG